MENEIYKAPSLTEVELRLEAGIAVSGGTEMFIPIDDDDFWGD